MPSTLLLGWPMYLLPNWENVSKSSSGKKPLSQSTLYSASTEWPLLRMKWSWSTVEKFSGVTSITRLYSTFRMSHTLKSPPMRPVLAR